MRFACANALVLVWMAGGCVSEGALAADPSAHTKVGEGVKPSSTRSMAGELSRLAGHIDYVYQLDGVTYLRTMSPAGIVLADGTARPRNQFPARGPGRLVISAPGNAPEQLMLGATKLGAAAGKVRNPVLSPDGRFAVYESTAHSFRDLYRADAHTGVQKRLTRDGDGAFAPAISPDSRYIAFITTRSGHGDVHVIDADGGNRRVITSSRANDSDPRWSADGTRLAFASDRHGAERIFVIPATGGAARRMTDLRSQNHHEIEPRWSPNGKHIAYLVHSADSRSELWVVDVASGERRRLSRARARAAHPCWSADSKFLYYSDGDDNADLWSARVTGTERLRLTNTPGHERLPRWRIGAQP